MDSWNKAFAGYDTSDYSLWTIKHGNMAAADFPPNIRSCSGNLAVGAFSADDMYAVGGDGDVWHFDGTAWHSCPFPTDASLETVCCAGDGLVYITEIDGSVWAGRSDGWTRIATASMSPGFQQVDGCWFNDRLYLGTQEGIWTIDAANVTNSGRLDISADGNFMLTTGAYGACIHDGTGWRRLFSAFDFN